MQKHSLILFCCAAMYFGHNSNALAQQRRELSLSEAVNLSINNNKSLKQSQFTLQGAKAAVEEAQDRRLPDIKLSGSYMRINTPNVSGNLLQMMAGQSNTGEQHAASDVNVNQVMFGMANASLPLYSGNRINNGIKAANYLAKAASYDVDHQKDLVIDNTVEAYYNLYKAQVFLKLVQENNRTALNRVKDFTNLEKNGVIPRNDLLSVQLQQKNMELAILDAENNVKIANYNFDLMLGVDEQTELVVQGLASQQNISLNAIDQYEAMAFANRNDLKAFESRINAAQTNTKINKGAYLPSVALTGGYVAADIHNMLTVTNAVNVGLGLSYNIADLYKNGAKIKQAKAQESALQMAQSNLLDGVKIEIHKAYQDVEESTKKVTVLKSAVDLANENYKIVKNKYDNSLATATELLDADANKLQAAINYEFSTIDNLISYNKLLRATGQITTTYTSSITK